MFCSLNFQPSMDKCLFLWFTKHRTPDAAAPPQPLTPWPQIEERDMGSLAENVDEHRTEHWMNWSSTVFRSGAKVTNGQVTNFPANGDFMELHGILIGNRLCMNPSKAATNLSGSMSMPTWFSEVLSQFVSYMGMGQRLNKKTEGPQILFIFRSLTWLNHSVLEQLSNFKPHLHKFVNVVRLSVRFYGCLWYLYVSMDDERRVR